MKILQDKVALITGGSRGIGAAIARRFAENGANVAFTYRSSEDEARQIEAELKEMGVEALAVKSDAGSFEQAEALIKTGLGLTKDAKYVEAIQTFNHAIRITPQVCSHFF